MHTVQISIGESLWFADVMPPASYVAQHPLGRRLYGGLNSIDRKI